MRAVLTCVAAVTVACSASVQTGTSSTKPGQTERPTSERPQVAERRVVHQVHKPKYEGDKGDYDLFTLKNKVTSLARHRGKVTFVAMWASFCTPCLHELPYLQALHDKYKRNANVRVILVSIDDNDARSRANVRELVARYKLTAPVLLDGEHQLMNRVAPRDKDGQIRYAVPMMVVIDDKFRLRRKWGMDHTISQKAFIAELSPMIDAALRGETPPPAKVYQPKPLGGFFSKRILRLTVKNLGANEVEFYKEELRHRIRKIVPNIHPRALAKVMVEVEAKLRKGGTFSIMVPDP